MAMTTQIEHFKLGPFAHMLDAGGATAAAYHLPRNCNFQLVVIDGGGKIAYSAGSEFSYYAEPNVHMTKIDKSLNEYPDGLLGAGITVPPGMAKAAHFFNLQRFDLVEQELARVSQGSPSAENMQFAESIRAREAEQRRARLLQIRSLADEQPVQAYREALSFIEAFPKSEEAGAISAVAANLIANPDVKQEIDAEVEYQRVVAPVINKAMSKAELKKIEPLLDRYMNIFGNTGYGTVARTAIADRSLLVPATTEADTGATPPRKDRTRRGGL